MQGVSLGGPIRAAWHAFETSHAANNVFQYPYANFEVRLNTQPCDTEWPLGNQLYTNGGRT